jgi:tRNA (cmo5U34)-methyltransferase
MGTSEKKVHDEGSIPRLLETARRDRIYSTQEAHAFAFGDEVAVVFDDMISRSVPCYLDLQLLVSSAAVRFYQEDTAVYDLGCSTGTSLGLLAKRLPETARIIGIDSSKAMILKAREKLESLQISNRIELTHERIQEMELEPSSFITANYTLQFFPEVDREPTLEKIFNALVPGGAFLISEKIQPTLAPEHVALVRDLHEDFKVQNGYTESEIARKRESLRGVMRPIDEALHIQQLRNAGFASVVPILRGYSFGSWLCIKE